MFLKLAHTKLDIFQCTRQLTLACYRLTKIFPDDERFVLVQQIRRAALSVHLNLAEGCSRKTKKERCRFFEISRGSVVEIDTALDIAHELKYCNMKDMESTGKLIERTFQMLSAMIESNQ